MITRSGKNERRPLRILPWWVAVFGALIVAASATVTTLGLLSIAGQNPQLRIEAIKVGLSVGAGTGAAVALLLAIRRQWLSERSQAHAEDVARDAAHDATERRVTELYGQAVEQLGHGMAAVRLGGLYSLERLAQDYPEYRQTVTDVVCAYLRMPFHSPPPLKHSHQGEPEPIPEHDRRSDLDPARQELQVRLTAQRVLWRHLTTTPREQDLPAAYWGGIVLDLAGALLVDFEFTRCQPYAADFREATFHGDASFGEARFQGAVSFSAARFTADAWFAGTQFREAAWFSGTYFQDSAFFTGSTFWGTAWFGGTRFGKAAEFGTTKFHAAAVFNNAQFDGTTEFGATKFCDDARFAATQFHAFSGFAGAEFGKTLDFDHAQFNGDAWFGGAEFHGNAWFGGARFENAARFGRAQFREAAGFVRAEFHGNVDFRDAQFASNPDFEHATVSQPDDHNYVWPASWQVELPSPEGKIARVVQRSQMV